MSFSFPTSNRGDAVSTAIHGGEAAVNAANQARDYESAEFAWLSFLLWFL
jgi:hypothetical protein